MIDRSPPCPILASRALVLAMLLPLAGCGNAPPPSPLPQPSAATGADDADGRRAYIANCAACHQRDGRGLRGAFPPLAGADWLREQPTERAIEAVLHGLRGPLIVNGARYDAVMPPMPYLSDDDVARILGYVYASWGNDARRVDAAEVGAVRARDDAGTAP